MIYEDRMVECKKCGEQHPLERYEYMFFYYFCPEVKRVMLVSNPLQQELKQEAKANGYPTVD